MDIISYTKANKTIKNTKAYESGTIGTGANGKYDSVDERLDEVEKQIEGRFIEYEKSVDTSQGTFVGLKKTSDGKLTLDKYSIDDTLNSAQKAYTQEYDSPGLLSTSENFKFISSNPTTYYGSYKPENVLTGGADSWDVSATLPNEIVIENKNMKRLYLFSFTNGPAYPSEYAKGISVYGGNSATVQDVLIGQISPSSNGRYTVSLNTKNIYKYLKIQITAKATDSYVNIGSFLFYEIKGWLNEKERYFKQGYWISPVIDLGEERVSTLTSFNETERSENSSYTKVMTIDYSSDGISFSATSILYKPNIIEKVPPVLGEDSEGNIIEIEPGYEVSKVNPEMNNSDYKAYRYLRFRVAITMNDYLSIPLFENKSRVVAKKYGVSKYLTEIERLNEINFAKLEFKTDSLMNAERNQMYNLIVDTLQSDTLIVKNDAQYDPLGYRYVGPGIIQINLKEIPSSAEKVNFHMLGEINSIAECKNGNLNDMNYLTASKSGDTYHLEIDVKNNPYFSVTANENVYSLIVVLSQSNELSAISYSWY